MLLDEVVCYDDGEDYGCEVVGGGWLVHFVNPGGFFLVLVERVRRG